MPRYGRYRCCHRHAGFPAFEPAFDLDRLCGLPSKGSGTPAHRGDLDTVGGRFMCFFSEYNGEPDLLFRLAQVKSAAIGDGHAQLIERTGGKFRYSLAVLVCD